MNTINIDPNFNITYNFELLKEFGNFVFSRPELVNKIGVQSVLQLYLFDEVLEFTVCNFKPLLKDNDTPEERYFKVKKHYKKKLNKKYEISPERYVDIVIANFLNKTEEDSYCMGEVITKLMMEDTYINYEIKYIYSIVIDWIYSCINKAEKYGITTRDLINSCKMFADNDKYKAYLESHNNNNSADIRSMLQHYYTMLMN